MPAEYYKTRELANSLKDWQSINFNARKSLISELGEMAVESATSDGEFAGACNLAANLLDTINKFPELFKIVSEKHKQISKD